MSIDYTVTETHRENVASGLSKVLADSYTLYLKTHNFHWNVTGPMFQTLHTMFETHYTELAVAVDDIAERIRALGVMSPGSYEEFSKMTTIKEATGKTDANEMIKQLANDHVSCAKTIKAMFPMAEEAKDEATLDLLTQRLNVHEKTSWMLRALLEG